MTNAVSTAVAPFQAYVLRQDENRKVAAAIETYTVDQLDDGAGPQHRVLAGRYSGICGNALQLYWWVLVELHLFHGSIHIITSFL